MSRFLGPSSLFVYQIVISNKVLKLPRLKYLMIAESDKYHFNRVTTFVSISFLMLYRNQINFVQLVAVYESEVRTELIREFLCTLVNVINLLFELIAPL